MLGVLCTIVLYKNCVLYRQMRSCALGEKYSCKMLGHVL